MSSLRDLVDSIIAQRTLNKDLKLRRIQEDRERKLDDCRAAIAKARVDFASIVLQAARNHETLPDILEVTDEMFDRSYFDRATKNITDCFRMPELLDLWKHIIAEGFEPSIGSHIGFIPDWWDSDPTPEERAKTKLYLMAHVGKLE